MFAISPGQIEEVCKWADLSDKEIRSDLIRNYIQNEDDYTSNFTGAFRRNINTYSRTGIRATSLLLSDKIERDAGCDAAIIIRSNGISKVAFFEAKWPRLRTNGYRWDYAQTSTGLSHYADQLDRQSRYLPTLAVFEMFYCEFPFGQQPAFMQAEVSSCVWHDQAALFRKSRADPDKVWDSSELIAMLSNGNVKISQILSAVCNCDAGEPIQMEAPELIATEFRLAGNILLLDCPEHNT